MAKNDKAQTSINDSTHKMLELTQRNLDLQAKAIEAQQMMIHELFKRVAALEVTNLKREES